MQSETMVRLNFSSIITIILPLLAIKVNTKRPEILTWQDNHYIKELTIKDIPEDCKNIGICSNISDYDTDFFNTLLRRIKNFRKFNADQVMVPYVHNTGEMEELCASKEEIIWPQAAKDEAGKWEYIINTNAIPFQGYRVERCIESGSRCSKAAVFERFNDFCHQEHYLRKMVYVDVKNKKLAIKYFQVPSCCSCRILEKY